MTLTQAQRAHLKERLQEERSRALAALNRTVAEHTEATEEERSGDVSAAPTHPADLGTDTMQEEVEAADAMRVSRQLAEIEGALDRLLRMPERFGLYEDTGEPIPFERLELIPWARTCAQAEEPRRTGR